MTPILPCHVATDSGFYLEVWCIPHATYVPYIRLSQINILDIGASAAVLFVTILCLPLGVVRKGEGKAIPLQAWTDPEGSRRLRLPHFRTVGT